MSKKKAPESCPCFSGNAYKRCCRPFHRGALPKTPVALMRSRYSAFALGLSKYIIDTTDPNGTAYQGDLAVWDQQIRQFTLQTTFVGLTVLDAPEPPGDGTGTVYFRAALIQNGRDASFTERSQFRQEGKRWLFVSSVHD